MSSSGFRTFQNRSLPGTPPYPVPVGDAVEVTFEEVAPGQLIHEWRAIAP